MKFICSGGFNLKKKASLIVGVLNRYFISQNCVWENKTEHKMFPLWKSVFSLLNLEIYNDFGEATAHTSWRSFAGEDERIAVLWFLIKCSPENLFNRLPEYSWKVFLPWQVVNMVDWCVKIRFWSGEKIPPLFDMVAVWKGKAGAHAHETIHWPANRGRHRLPS